MTDFSKLAFTSQFRYERITQKGSSSFSIVGGGFGNTTVTINHGLGYIPLIKGKYTYNDGKYFDLWNGPQSYNIDGNGTQISNLYVDNNYFVVFLENFGVPAVLGYIYYRIYAEPQL